MKIVTVHEAKTQLSKLIERATRGEPFIIAKAGKPLVKVTALDAPVAEVGEVVGQLGDDLEQRSEFLGRAAGEVIGREQVERRDLDPEIVAPLEELVILRRSRAMTVRRRLELALPGPATIAVDDHGDVPWERLLSEVAADAALVEAVEKAPSDGNLALIHTGYASPKRLPSLKINPRGRVGQ